MSRLSILSVTSRRGFCNAMCFRACDRMRQLLASTLVPNALSKAVDHGGLETKQDLAPRPHAEELPRAPGSLGRSRVCLNATSCSQIIRPYEFMYYASIIHTLWLLTHRRFVSRMEIAWTVLSQVYWVVHDRRTRKVDCRPLTETKIRSDARTAGSAS